MARKGMPEKSAFMAKFTPAEEKLLELCRETIDSLIRKWSDNIEADPEAVIDGNTRYRMNDRIMIDSAIGQMWAAILSRPDNVLGEVDDLVPVWRAAYHHAVDSYFRIYFKRKPGRPALEAQACRELLNMRGRGMSYARIGLALKLDKEVVRKRVASCQKRFGEAGKNSRE